MQKNPKIFYGWIIVAAGMLILAAAVGLVSNSFGLFIVPVCNELGFSRQAMAFNQTLTSLGGMVVAALSGQIFRRYRLDRLMKVSSIVLTLSYIAYSLSFSLPAFYIASIFVSISQALLTWMPFSVILNNWFNQRRGLAVGITFMGSGLGGMAFSALGGQLLENFGWRPTIQIMGVILAVLVIPAVFLVIRIHPREMNLEPYGVAPEAYGQALPADDSGLSFTQALKNARFYVIGLSILCIGIANNGVVTTIAPNLVDTGYSATFSANIVALAMGALAAGKLLLGVLYDKLGTRPASCIALGAILTSTVGMYFAKYLVAMPLIICGMGLGAAFCTVALPLLTRNVFGNRAYGAITGIFTACNNLGSAIGPILLGRICDSVGSYTPGYLILFALALVFSGILILFTPSSPKTK